MPDRRRRPNPWEAAQMAPPRNPVRRAVLSARIRLTAALIRGGISNG